MIQILTNIDFLKELLLKDKHKFSSKGYNTLKSILSQAEKSNISLKQFQVIRSWYPRVNARQV